MSHSMCQIFDCSTLNSEHHRHSRGRQRTTRLWPLLGSSAEWGCCRLRRSQWSDSLRHRPDAMGL